MSDLLRFPTLVAMLIGTSIAYAATPPLRAAAPTDPQTTTSTPGRGADESYVIGPDDALSIVFWRQKDLSADVIVRADGKISLPLLNDVHASGLTPLQLRAELEKAATRYVEDPVATVVVKQINSRKVFVTGMVQKPGAYALTGRLTTLQLIATAGGFKDFADTKHIVVVRSEAGRRKYFRFDYHAVERRKRGAEDIDLEPGDTVIVP